MTNTEQKTKAMPSRLRSFLLATVAALALAGGAEAAAPARNAVRGNGPRPGRIERRGVPEHGGHHRVSNTKRAQWGGLDLLLGLGAHAGHAAIEEWRADRAEERQEKLMEAARQNSAGYTTTTTTRTVRTGAVQEGAHYEVERGANGQQYLVKVDNITGKRSAVPRNVKYDYDY